ncbi:hypothetical protein BS47DRAFT_1360445 [Hydnum rufescens UP504]|uniref:Uncharacterized protein n=1 Tax=Hydnum rufescens UP504 TaxID=1448309 RepID=A0A9P6B218_9AGAM|nr:hypothetical protein BS47DRAFT_1360445 [Hydnum rufescens UP504]
MPQSVTNNNRLGKNGHDNGTCPSDSDLRAALLNYEKWGIENSEQCVCLTKEFGYNIGASMYYKCLQQKQARPDPEVPRDPQCSQGPISGQWKLHWSWTMVDQDPEQLNRPLTIGTQLRFDGVPIAYDHIHEILQKYHPEGVEKHVPGTKTKMHKPLIAIGPFDEIHGDGHEKLGHAALRFGPGLPVYGFKDKYSKVILHLVVVPNSRRLPLLDMCTLIWSQNIKVIAMYDLDKGSETGEMWAFQKAFREIYAPSIDSTIIAPWKALKSTDNTPIETVWSLFYWIWVPIHQKALDDFVEFWNAHTICKQSAAPAAIMAAPELYGGEDVHIPVTLDGVQALRHTLSKSREESMAFFSLEFGKWADAVFAEIQQPKVTLESAWDIFNQMAACMK